MMREQQPIIRQGDVKKVKVRWHDGFEKYYICTDMQFGSSNYWFKLVNGLEKWMPRDDIRHVTVGSEVTERDMMKYGKMNNNPMRQTYGDGHPDTREGFRRESIYRQNNDAESMFDRMHTPHTGDPDRLKFTHLSLRGDAPGESAFTEARFPRSHRDLRGDRITDFDRSYDHHVDRRGGRRGGSTMASTTMFGDDGRMPNIDPRLRIEFGDNEESMIDAILRRYPETIIGYMNKLSYPTAKSTLYVDLRTTNVSIYLNDEPVELPFRFSRIIDAKMMNQHLYHVNPVDVILHTFDLNPTDDTAADWVHNVGIVVRIKNELFVSLAIESGKNATEVVELVPLNSIQFDGKYIAAVMKEHNARTRRCVKMFAKEKVANLMFECLADPNQPIAELNACDWPCEESKLIYIDNSMLDDPMLLVGAWVHNHYAIIYADSNKLNEYCIDNTESSMDIANMEVSQGMHHTNVDMKFDELPKEGDSNLIYKDPDTGIEWVWEKGQYHNAADLYSLEDITEQVELDVNEVHVWDADKISWKKGGYMPRGLDVKAAERRDVETFIMAIIDRPEDLISKSPLPAEGCSKTVYIDEGTMQLYIYTDDGGYSHLIKPEKLEKLRQFLTEANQKRLAKLTSTLTS